MNGLIFKNKKVLVFGLGILGGGVATANWLLRQGAQITITDLKRKEQLYESLKKIKGEYKLSLGGHKKTDIDANEIIVVNPDVPIKNKFVRYAYGRGKIVVNEASIFFEKFRKPLVAVTGTRGKTTIVNWINHFLKTRLRSSPAGNSTDYQFLKILNLKNRLDVAVIEISSFHLEYFRSIKTAPDIAVITNIYQDHLNRHNTIKNYILTKANIFKKQSENQNLVLNYDNEWTKVFLKLKPKAKTWFFSLKFLPLNLNGLYYKKNNAILNFNGKGLKVLNLSGFEKDYGKHNLQNVLVSSLVAYLFNIKWNSIQGAIRDLPSIEFRQQRILENKKLVVINDTAATSPEGGIAALERFGGPNTILIAGGTNRNLDYKEWSKVVLKKIRPQNLIFLSGSSTNKMLHLLRYRIEKPMVYENLEDCVEKALKTVATNHRSIILFSPAAKSFEKFKNEYDRGKKFNMIVKKFLKNINQYE
ncbi:MAG: UDP-N-acetylmuramoyl-L-alanine--D-glutamate ligase [Patescibacteria group bacterium]